MYDPLLLRTDDVSVDRPFTHPWHVAVDHAYLVELFVDLLRLLPNSTWHTAAGQQTLFYPDHEHCHKRIILLDGDYLQRGAALSVIGFFGNKQRTLSEEIVAEINAADRQLTARFTTFADIVCYYTILLPDGYNYANLVLLKRPEGVIAWNASPLHQHAARFLSPRFYDNVRIYHGTIPAGSNTARPLRLTSVKYWDFRTTPTWHAIRELTAA
ncbi:MAG: hypothetical protein KDE31_36375 [Caldilineaceae bacterium]|nr:hypothetical protein [Caldilineaceae bacterium]